MSTTVTYGLENPPRDLAAKGDDWVWLTDDPETWPDAQDGRSYYVWAYELGQLIDGGDDRYRKKLAAGKMDEYYTSSLPRADPLSGYVLENHGIPRNPGNLR